MTQALSQQPKNQYPMSSFTKGFRLLLWIALLVMGFFAGVAWKNKETAAPAPPPEDTTTLPAAPPRTDLTEEEKANIKLFQSAAPSVCFITTTAFVRTDFFSRNLTEMPQGSGSGFVWDKEGHIITNFHVIKDADRAQVTLADQSVYDAKLVGYAAEKDLAVLRIDAPPANLRPIPLGGSRDLLVGQVAYAIGNPFGLDQTLTKGIISALGREIESVARIPIRDVIQTDAAINPGNSGGPLLDSSGRLIGVNTAIYSPSGASAGIGFSIPVDEVRWVVPELIAYGEIRRPSLGVTFVAQTYYRSLGIKEGALIYRVMPGSNAERNGIRPTLRDRAGRIRLGDIITRIGSEPIENVNDVQLALEKYKPGQTVPVEIFRDGQAVTIDLTLDEPQKN